MLPFFGSLQFLSPWFLAALGITPLLIYAYRKKSPRLRQVVSSIVVLRLLTPRAAPKTRFKPPLRFFLELLALLLLCAAAAMPVSLDEDHRFALVVDNTLSMRAFDASSSLPATRLDRAKTAAHKWLDEHEKNATIDVFETSPKLSRVGDERQSLGAANDSIDKISASTAGDNLEASVSELVENGRYERVVVISDKLAEYTDAKSADDALFSEQKIAKMRTRVVGVTVGEPVANVYVNSFTLLPDALSASGGKLVATVGSSGQNSADVEVAFSELAEGEKLLDKKTLRLSSENTVDVVFELPQSSGKNSLFKVAVRSLKGAPGSKEDSITEDNVGWLVPNASAGERILLVAEENVLAHSGLESISAFSMEQITPSQFAERALENYKLIIFHRAAPNVLPQKPTLLILPPESNPIFPSHFIEKESQISSWVSEHPITSYLKVPLLRAVNGEIFDVPLWAQGIVRIEQGAIVVAGESHGIRLAAVGMELLPFEGMKTPAASVLTLNLLNWLTGGAELTGSNLTGSSVTLDPTKSWSVRKPGGKEEALRGSLKLEQAGLYFLTNKTGERKQIAANAFFPGESNTNTKMQYSAPSAVEHERKLDEGSKFWWSTLISFALGILLLEQFLFLLPERRKAA